MVAHSSETKRRGGGDGAEIEPQSRKFVFQFAGQGVRPRDITQYVNLLRETDCTELDKNIAIAQEVSHFPIAYYLKNPSHVPEIFELNNNAFLQMVVHTLNVTAGDIAMRKLRELRIPLTAVETAGHSLGEVAAMDMAGVFSSREESMEFVFARGTAMERAHRKNPGNLYAVIGLNEARVQQLCDKHGWTISLKNSPQSIVVAASAGLKDAITEKVKELGGKTTVIDLEIPGFHAERYMLPAQQELREWTGDKRYNPTRISVWPNSNARPSMSGSALVREHIDCMTRPVQWSKTLTLLRNKHRDGVAFVALGPGKNIASINEGNNIPAEQTIDLPQLLAA